MRPKGIVAVNEEQLAQIVSEFPSVLAAYLFGSVVRGDADHFSDVDVAVLLEDGLTKEQRWDIVGRLLDALFSVVGQDKADVVDLKEAPIWFQKVVIKTGKLFYERDPVARMNYEASVSQLREQDERKWSGIEEVRLRLETLERNLTHLSELAKLSREEFTADLCNVAAAERCLQTSIEALVDISRHLIRRLNLPMPEEHCQIPQVLAEAGYLPAEDVPTCVAMVRFHNRLVHRYFEVTPEEVYRIVTQELDDIHRWLDQLLQALKTLGQQ
ncbi:MAG: type VII toxin-antitoxin system HepT family RNase toxin [Armatimonadota bacterium]